MSDNQIQDRSAEPDPGNRKAKGCNPVFWLLVGLALVIVIGILLPPIQISRGGHPQTDSRVTLNQIQRAILLYDEQINGFSICSSYYSFDFAKEPDKAEFEPADKTNLLLSWRVRILPYLEQKELYDRFHLDEPWDSPHNLTLLPKMPSIYRRPWSKLPKDDYRTHYLALRGPEMALRPDGKIVIPDAIRDGMSRTITLVEVDDDWAVPWTKPEDLDVTWNAPGILDRLRRFKDDSFVLGGPSLDTFTIRKPITTEQFFQMCTIDGGEEISPEDFK